MVHVNLFICCVFYSGLLSGFGNKLVLMLTNTGVFVNACLCVSACEHVFVFIYLLCLVSQDIPKTCWRFVTHIIALSACTLCVLISSRMWWKELPLCPS